MQLKGDQLLAARLERRKSLDDTAEAHRLARVKADKEQAREEASIREQEQEAVAAQQQAARKAELRREAEKERAEQEKTKQMYLRLERHFEVLT
jgi:hypothetical protein